MPEKENESVKKSPNELAKQLEIVVSLIGENSAEREIAGPAAFMIVSSEMVKKNPLRFASEIRSGVDGLLNQTGITNAYKLHIKELVEDHLTNPHIRLHAKAWFGNSVTPILEECGIDLEECWGEEEFPDGTNRNVLLPPELGIFDPNKNKLKILERDVIRLRLSGWGSDKPGYIAKMQRWCREFKDAYGEDPPLSNQGDIDNSVIGTIWMREKYY